LKRPKRKEESSKTRKGRIFAGVVHAKGPGSQKRGGNYAPKRLKEGGGGVRVAKLRSTEGERENQGGIERTGRGSHHVARRSRVVIEQSERKRKKVCLEWSQGRTFSLRRDRLREGS